MSDVATAWLRRNVFGIGQGAKFLLLTLANYADANNECFPGVELLAYELECDVRTVKRHLKKLRELGLVEVTERYRACDDPRCGQKNKHAHRTSNYYRLVLKEVDLRVQTLACEYASVTKGDNLSPLGGQATSDILSPIGEVAENQGFSHRGQFVTHAPIGDTVDTPLVTPVSPILIGNEQPALESPYLTEPEPVANLRVVESSHGQVGSGALTRSKVANELSQAEAAVLASCVPSAMQAMDTSSARAVVSLLRERLEVGWKPFEIRQILDAPLPSDVGHLGSLVAYRIRENISLSGAPARLRAQAEQAHQQAEEERLAACVEPFEASPEMLEFYADLERNEPGLPHSQKAIRWHNYQREQRSREGVRAHV